MKIIDPKNASTLTTIDIGKTSKGLLQSKSTLNKATFKFAQTMSTDFSKLLGDHSFTVKLCEVADHNTLPTPLNKDFWMESTLDDELTLLTQINNTEITRLTEILFGHSRTSENEANDEQTPISNTELRMMHRLLDLQCRCIQTVLGLSELNPASRQTTHLPELDHWLLQSVSMLINNEIINWNLWWPTNATTQVLTCGDKPNNSAQLQQQFATASQNIPFSLTVQLGQKKLALGEVKKMAVGQIFAIDLAKKTTASLAGQPFVRGEITEHNGRLVLDVTECLVSACLVTDCTATNDRQTHE
jgi:flagellar motor switch protein FliM